MIEREDTDDVVVLRMAYGKANALDHELGNTLIETFDQLNAQDHRPVVITGSDRIFSAGVDLFRIVNEGEEYLKAFFPILQNVFARLFDFPRPLVAAINGHAIAGGCVIACACDYRLAATGSGRIGVPELLVGVPFPTMALEILRFAIGNAHLQQAVYTGNTFDTEEAMRLGFIDEIAEDGALLDVAIQRARHLASVPARSYALSKRQLREPVTSRVAARAPEDEGAVRAVWMDPKTLENMRSYLERTFGERIKGKLG
jgi:enoyl-CoA hydratase